MWALGRKSFPPTLRSSVGRLTCDHWSYRAAHGLTPGLLLELKSGDRSGPAAMTVGWKPRWSGGWGYPTGQRRASWGSCLRRSQRGFAPGECLQG